VNEARDLPARPVEIVRPDVVLRGVEWPAAEPAVVLLHGLAGHAGEWWPVVDRLRGHARVVAFDQRGHGHSTRAPQDMTRSAHVDDVACVISDIATAPVTLIGHSLGGHTAMLTAARRPDLVERLVIIEASPARNPTAAVDAARWLARWPRPFPTRDAAIDFFGGGTAGQAWADGLRAAEDGLRPRFDTAIVLRALDEIVARAWWDQWDTVTCPTLLLRGASGWLSHDDVDRMTRTGPRAHLVQVADAGHDVHLDQPERTARAIIDCALARR
jgi:pimeloyl-ACP methyl ester carboxylesterase